MRYIGNKENIVDRIYSILKSEGVCGQSFCDLFAGTTSVSRYYKKKGYRIISADILYMSYCLQKAYIENNSIPQFDKLLNTIGKSAPMFFLYAEPIDIVIAYLNNLPPTKGFIYNNYTPEGTKNLPTPRMYFSNENGAKIDAIRQTIEQWYSTGLLQDAEYYILLACIIESVSFYANVAGVYAAFYKKWDPRAIKPLTLRRIEILSNCKQNKVYNTDSTKLIDKIDSDILYLDPPYNQRQYLPNYHLIETIAKYDNPVIKGVTGIRANYYKSEFCNKSKALLQLDYIAKTSRSKFLVMSYNSEGLMQQGDILSVLSKYGNVTFRQFENARFKSNNNGDSATKRVVYEHLYILKK